MLANLISIQTQAVIGLAVLGLGWGLGRWAERHDIKSWVTSAAWRAVWTILRRRDWGQLRRPDIESITASDPTLKRQIGDKVEAIKADAGRLGRTRTAIKHGGIHALAHVAGMVTGPLKLTGLLVLAHAAWRWLG